MAYYQPRLRGWTDWAQEVHHRTYDDLFAPPVIVNDLFPDPNRGQYSWEPPRAAITSGRDGKKKQATSKTLEAAQQPYALTYWQSPDRSRGKAEEPRTYDYRFDLPRDVLDSFNDIMANPTYLSPYRSTHQLPQRPKHEKQPKHAFHDYQTSLFPVPDAPMPAHIPRYAYAAPTSAQSARPKPVPTGYTPPQMYHSDLHHQGYAQYSPQSLRAQNFRAQPAPTPKVAAASAFPQYSHPHKHRPTASDPQRPPASIGAFLTDAAAAGARRPRGQGRRVDDVDQLDTTDPYGRAWHHGGPFDPLQGAYHRHTTSAGGQAAPQHAVRFDKQTVLRDDRNPNHARLKSPPPPTAALDSLVHQVREAREEGHASFGDLYEHTYGPVKPTRHQPETAHFDPRQFATEDPRAIVAAYGQHLPGDVEYFPAAYYEDEEDEALAEAHKLRTLFGGRHASMSATWAPPSSLVSGGAYGGQPYGPAPPGKPAKRHSSAAYVR